MICPRLAREARQQLCRTEPRRGRGDLVNVERELLYARADLDVHREGSHIDCRSGGYDLHGIRPVFRNAQRKAAVLHPVVQCAEVNKS